MRKIVPYLSFSSSYTWYISSESDIFSVYPISILGFVSIYSGYTLLLIYIQCIYQWYTIIYFRICKFIQWIYFVVLILKYMQYLQWKYRFWPSAAQRRTISRGTARCPSIAFQDPGPATVVFMCHGVPHGRHQRHVGDHIWADRQPGPSARHSASPEQEYRPLHIDCLPGLGPSDDTFHVSCTAVTQWRVDDHICCWILNSDWKPARRTRVLQLEIPWRGRAPKLSTPRLWLFHRTP